MAATITALSPGTDVVRGLHGENLFSSAALYFFFVNCSIFQASVIRKWGVAKWGRGLGEKYSSVTFD